MVDVTVPDADYEPYTNRQLALVPVAAYATLGDAALVALSAVCVLLIAGSLYTMFGSDEEPSAHA